MVYNKHDQHSLSRTTTCLIKTCHFLAAQMPSGTSMVSGRGNQHMMGQHNPMGYGGQNFQYGGGAGGGAGMNPGAAGNQVPNPNFPAGGGGAGGGMGMPGTHHPQQPPQYSMYPPGANPGSHMQQHYPPGMGVQQGRWAGLRCIGVG